MLNREFQLISLELVKRLMPALSLGSSMGVGAILLTAPCVIGCDIESADVAEAAHDVAPALDPPRPIGPLSTATVTSQRPTFHWSPAAGSVGARIYLCRDRALTRGCETADANGTSWRPTRALSAGVWFWGLRARAGALLGARMSPVWQIVVGARSAPIDTSWGSTLDLDGDGYAEIAVGSPFAAGSKGRVYIYRGGPAGPGADPAYTLASPNSSDVEFGGSVASAGDVNGDGFADLLVKGFTADRSSIYLHVYLGGAAGVAALPIARLSTPHRSLDTTGDLVGDFNGDGYADLLVGAALHFGGPSGTAESPSLGLRVPLADGGEAIQAISGAGDINSDGLADIAVSTSTTTAEGWQGRLHVYQGARAVPGPDRSPSFSVEKSGGDPTTTFGTRLASAGDVNGDGFADLFVTETESHRSITAVKLYLGSRTEVLFLPADTTNSVAFASPGDLDGDGFTDIVVGSAVTALGDPPRVYIYRGAQGNTAAELARVVAGQRVLMSPGPSADSVFGVEVGTADVNGDGLADLFVRDTGANDDAGAVYFYPGRPAGVRDRPDRTLRVPGG